MCDKTTRKRLRISPVSYIWLTHLSAVGNLQWDDWNETELIISFLHKRNVNIVLQINEISVKLVGLVWFLLSLQRCMYGVAQYRHCSRDGVWRSLDSEPRGGTDHSELCTDTAWHSAHCRAVVRHRGIYPKPDAAQEVGAALPLGLNGDKMGVKICLCPQRFIPLRY